MEEDKIDIKSINNKLTGAKCNSVKFVSDNVICAGFDNKKVYEYNIKTKKGHEIDIKPEYGYEIYPKYDEYDSDDEMIEDDEHDEILENIADFRELSVSNDKKYILLIYGKRLFLYNRENRKPAKQILYCSNKTKYLENIDEPIMESNGSSESKSDTESGESKSESGESAEDQDEDEYEIFNDDLYITCAKFSPDNKYIGITLWGGRMLIYKIRDIDRKPKLILEKRYKTPTDLISFNFSSDGKYICVPLYVGDSSYLSIVEWKGNKIKYTFDLNREESKYKKSTDSNVKIIKYYIYDPYDIHFSTDDQNLYFSTSNCNFILKFKTSGERFELGTFDMFEHDTVIETVTKSGGKTEFKYSHDIESKYICTNILSMSNNNKVLCYTTKSSRDVSKPYESTSSIKIYDRNIEKKMIDIKSFETREKKPVQILCSDFRKLKYGNDKYNIIFGLNDETLRLISFVEIESLKSKIVNDMDTYRFNRSKSFIPTPIKQQRVADPVGKRIRTRIEYEEVSSTPESSTAEKKSKKIKKDGRRSIKRSIKRKSIKRSKRKIIS
jgi:hypothetical protein